MMAKSSPGLAILDTCSISMRYRVMDTECRICLEIFFGLNDHLDCAGSFTLTEKLRSSHIRDAPVSRCLADSGGSSANT